MAYEVYRALGLARIGIGSVVAEEFMRSRTDIIGDGFIWLRKRAEGCAWRWKCYLSLLRAYQECGRFCRRIRNGSCDTHGVCLRFFSEKRNFGDALNVDLMRWLGVSHVQATEDSANLVCIGSLLDEFLVTDWQRLRYVRELHVFGSGFMYPKESTSEQFNRPVVIHGLRGKLSLSRCEEICGRQLSDVVLGDPGLLVSDIFPLEREKVHDVGVICHYNDIHAEALSNLRLDGLKVVMIDVHIPTVEFARLVAGCRFVLSSALHGLICADAYGVPNRHVLLSGRVEGGEYKFRDYYSVFASSGYFPIDLREREITAADVLGWMEEPVVKWEEIRRVQSELKRLMARIGEHVG